MAPTVGLEGYWKLDNARDSSGQTRDLTLTGAPGFIAGHIGLALSLPGSAAQFASRSVSDPEFDFGANADFTIQLWVRVIVGGTQVFLVKNTPTVDGWSLFVTGPGPVAFNFEQVGVGVVTTAATFALGVFHHVVVVKSSGIVEIFVNGVSAGGPTALGAFVASPNVLTLGQEPGGTLPATADLDEIAIWNRAITVPPLANDELSQLYNAGLGLTLIRTPTVATLTPNTGKTIGETLVTIVGANFNDEVSGGTVQVFFDGVEATKTALKNSTQIFVNTPRFTQDAPPTVVDVEVRNILPNPPGPDLTEPVILLGGFTYRRPSIATDDIAANTRVVKVNQELIRQLRRFVINNTKHNVHPEYVDPLGAVTEEEKQAETPSLKIVGPNIQEDRFYAINGRIAVDNLDGTFKILDQPITVMLSYQYVCVGRSSSEAINLWRALTQYFNRTPRLIVPLDGNDPSNGTVDYEIAPIWEERGDARTSATRQGVYQVKGAFTIHGVDVVADEIGIGQELQEGNLILDIQQNT